MKPLTFIFTTLFVTFFVLSLETKAQNGCDLCGPDSGKTINHPLGNYSATIGIANTTAGTASLAVGKYTYASAGTSFALGSFLRSTATNAIVIGSGLNEQTANMLANTFPNTLMIGFNSRVPTLFISSAKGNSTTGKIGIGNVMEPRAKLHIEGDNNEDASILLRPKNTREHVAYIALYDESNKISASKKDGLELNATTITLKGRIGINIKNDLSEDMDFGFAVKGGILTDKVYIREVTEWHDEVFSDDYHLTTLPEIKQYIELKGHLPEIPSEQEVMEKGYDMVEIQGLLLKKIEELTLYVIELDQKIKELTGKEEL